MMKMNLALFGEPRHHAIEPNQSNNNKHSPAQERSVGRSLSSERQAVRRVWTDESRGKSEVSRPHD